MIRLAACNSKAQLLSDQVTLVVRRSRTVWSGTIGSTTRQILDTLRHAPDLKNYLPLGKLFRSRIVGSMITRHAGCRHHELLPQAHRKSIRHPSPHLFNWMLSPHLAHLGKTVTGAD